MENDGEGTSAEAQESQELAPPSPTSPDESSAEVPDSRRSIRAVDTDPDLILATPAALAVVPRGKGRKRGHIPKGLSQPLSNYTKTPHSTRLMLRELEEKVGGREKLATILSYLPTDPQEAILIKLMNDPKLSVKSLAALAARTGFSAGRVYDFFQRGKAAEAFVKSMVAVYDKTPDVAADVMTQALPRTERCTAVGCDRGKLPAPPVGPDKKKTRRPDCNVCEGRGYVMARPEVERQRLALEVSGLVKKGAGVVVNNTNNNVNAAVMTPASIFARFMEASDKVLFSGSAAQGSVVEAEVTPVAPAPQEEVQS